MDLRAQLGQKLMFGFPGYELDEDSLRLIREYKASNFILFTRNVKDITQLKALCDTLHRLVLEETGLPPIITIDEEGGVVSRLPEGATRFPSAMAVASTGKPENAHLAGLYTGQELAAFGINMNMAPVCDLNTNPDNPVIGVRSYGDSMEAAGPYILGMMQGQLEAGILPVVKHFPGHGDTSQDSHLALPVVDKSEAALMECELVPFRAAIAAGAPCVMTTHILFPQLEKENLPATMSPTILQGLLRGKLGFEGLIVSDCLEMDAIAKFYGTPEGFLAAVKAGVDLPCISHHPKLAMQALDMTLAAVEKGELDPAIIEESAARIARYKNQYGNPSAPLACVGSAAHLAAAGRMNRESICHVGPRESMPAVNAGALFAGSYAYRATIASGPVDESESFAKYMAGAFGAGFAITPVNPGPEDIEALLAKTHSGQTVVFGSYNGHINRGQVELVNALSRAGRAVVCVALRNPYDLALLDDDVYKLAAFQYDSFVFEALVPILRGAGATGRLSVTLG